METIDVQVRTHRIEIVCQAGDGVLLLGKWRVAKPTQVKGHGSKAGGDQGLDLPVPVLSAKAKAMDQDAHRSRARAITGQELSIISNH